MRVTALFCAGAFAFLPQAAMAECLGRGCYDGFIIAFLVYSLGLIAIIGLPTWLVWRTWGRRAGVSLLCGLLLLIALLVGWLLGQF